MRIGSIEIGNLLGPPPGMRCRRCRQEKKPEEFSIARAKKPMRMDVWCDDCLESRKTHAKDRYKIKRKVTAEDRCEICYAAEELVIDHDHSTGVFRGILCGSCNTAIGMFKDNPALLWRASQYIHNHWKGKTA